ncbi:hypothetical protein EWM62_12320 [Mucilaginibacter terrigena]|uniref:Uncharacterized protein n=1 Tax=Mucilaginibacter terrigena TaxID=2492395 RepID=A0A4Q5LL03_9SPHI|nr:hypothetical protein [Mucilaginibacter terrigena]RYU90306.1 hypothetical protein EWM62_12320 [Mucilaginibacter terrigena]
MKFIKTLIFSVVALGAVTLSSCTKDDDNDIVASATISASIDGTETTFNKNVVGTTGSVNGATFTSIQGSDAAGNTLSVTITGALTAGKTYVATSGNDDEKPVILYTTTDNEAYLNADDDVSNAVSVTLSSVSSNNTIQGSFKGKVSTLLVGNGAVKSKTVTNGKFNVKVNQ